MNHMITESEYLKAIDIIKAYRNQILESASDVLGNTDKPGQYERMCTKIRCKNNTGLNHWQSHAYLTIGKIYDKYDETPTDPNLRSSSFTYKDDRGRIQRAKYSSRGTRDRWEFLP
jgi:hypothetical protein